MAKMTLLFLLGDGQPAFAIGTVENTGSLGVSFALPAKGGAGLLELYSKRKERSQCTQESKGKIRHGSAR